MLFGVGVFTLTLSYLKRQFGFVKVRYRGLDKNANHLFALCALANLEMASRRWKVA